MKKIILIIKKCLARLRPNITLDKVKSMESLFLYAGDVPYTKEYSRKDLVGLSIKRGDYRTLKHDVTQKYPLEDNSVDAYQAEDVFEHVDYSMIVDCFNEIYRILKPGGYFRLSIPDYGCDLLNKRTIKNDKGEIIFDPDGGGDFVDGKVVNGGHVWFPRYQNVLELIKNSKFEKFDFYHYYDENNQSVTKEIDYSKGWIQRTPDHDQRVANPYRAMSLVVDLYK